jgi:rfaE bifunctional protein nucleotidyltransferase chain/domain
MNVAPAPILTLDEAASLAEAQRAAGRVVVLANGVFDLMHPGHLRFLEAARAKGDLLIVAVHSDRIVRQTKGLSRPILPEAERAELLAALASVDAVFIVDADPTSAAIIERIKPGVMAPDSREGVTEYSTSALIAKVAASQ